MSFRPMISTTGLWQQLKARLLADATLQTLLYGIGHVYVETDDYGSPERAEGLPWARIVIAPATGLWDSPDAPGLLHHQAFIVRAECNKFSGAGYDPQLALEGLHQQVLALLDNHTPDPLPGVATRVAFPIFLQRMIEPRLLWDDARQLYFMTAEYRCEVTTS